MKKSDDDLRQAIALFRYGVIAGLVHLPLGTKGVGARLREKASQPYAIPGTDRTRVAADTMRDWIRHYRDGGFEGLFDRKPLDGAYRSRHLALICAKLGVVLVHARPYQPAGKGKIERWFRTLRAGWLAHLDAPVLDSLQTLNRSLWAWIEGEYHDTPHRGLEGRTPLDR